jgi:hypothetical protein
LPRPRAFIRHPVYRRPIANGLGQYAGRMQWYEGEVRALERTNAGRVNGNHPPVFYGSSSIRLWDTLGQDVDPRVMNLGFGGATLEACDYFFPRLVPPLHPRSLLLLRRR